MPKTLTSRSDIEREFEDHAAAIMQLETQQDAMSKKMHEFTRMGRAAAYNDDGSYKGVFANEDAAETFGLQLMAATHEDQAVAQRCYNRVKRDLGSGIESEGGAMVPIEFSDRVKRLLESYGVAIRNMYYMPMAGESLTFLKQTGEVTVFLLSEGVKGSESDIKVERVTLQSKEWGTLSYYPRSLEDDAAVLVGEMVARSIFFAFARKADQIVFNGDGSAEYFGIQGIIPKLKTINGIDEGAGLVLGSGNAWSELTLEDFQRVQGRLPEYEGETMNKWYMSRRFYFEVPVKLMLDAGGVTAEELEGRRQRVFLGDPVELVQVMPKAEGNSQVCALYGDMARAATYGDRRRMNVESSREYKFAERQVTVLGINRCAISIEDLGTDTEAGPIVGLITQAT